MPAREFFVGVISDTHGLLRPLKPSMRFAGQT